MKKFLSLIALILLISFSTASAAQSVTDKAGVLKATETELLNQKIHEIERAHKIKIGVSFVKSLDGRDIVQASDDILYQNFSNGKNGGIVLLVDMNDRKYEMATDTRMLEQITDSDGISFLKDKFTSDLSAGNYYGAVNNFADGVDELMTYYETNGVAYGQRMPGEIDPMAAGLAVIIAIFLGVMIRSILIGLMSNVHHATAASDYLKKNTVKIFDNHDTFLFMTVKRRPKSSSSRSGGHSGGGGGGSF